MLLQIASLSFLFWAVIPVCKVNGSPDHDGLQAKIKTITAPQRYLSSHDRRLDTSKQSCPQVKASGTVGPLRIGYELVDVGTVSVDIQNLVKDTLMRKAAAYWGSTLRVIQASEPLRIPRRCTSTYGNTCVASSSLPTCGSDLTVPNKYLESLQVCTEYCSPGYRCSGNCVASGQCACNIDQWQAQRGSYCCQLTPDQTCPSSCDENTAIFTDSYAYCVGSCTTYPQGDGAVDEDLHVFVTIKEKGNCAPGEASGSLASATWCAKDQCDRPIFANINFCPDELSLLPGDVDKQVSTAVHELGHALGFSSSLYRYFRDTDGNPKVPRQNDDPDDFPSATRWFCKTGYQIQYPTLGSGDGVHSHVDLDPSNIVKAFSERGFNDCQCPVGKTTMGSDCVMRQDSQTPSCVMRMVLPTVVAEARAFFDCTTLPGAELENQPTSDCSIFGSHWEQRVFNGEVMASTHSSETPTYLSRVTLALFQDSGWYEVDFAMADTLTKGVHWGYMQGCPFAGSRCVSSGSPVNRNMFCTDVDASSQAHRCSLDRTQVMGCHILGYQPPIPSQFDYGINNHLGALAQLDFCPTYSTTLTNRLCYNGAVSITYPYSNQNFMREVFGSQARCFDSTLRGAIGNLSPGSATTFYSQPTPTCYEVECAADSLSYKLKVTDVQTAGQTIVLGTCSTEGEQLSGSFQGAVTCASPAEICQIRLAIHTQGGVATSTTSTSTTATLSRTATGAISTTMPTSTTGGLSTPMATSTTKISTTATLPHTSSGVISTTVAVSTTKASTTATSIGVIWTTMSTSTTKTRITATWPPTSTTQRAIASTKSVTITDTTTTITTTLQATTTKNHETTTELLMSTVPETTIDATTITYTSILLGGVVTGSFAMDVSDPMVFANDAEVVNAVAAGIAIGIGVSSEWVTVTIVVSASRRLRFEQDREVRRLAGSVEVDYTITLPTNAASDAVATASTLSTVSAEALTKAIVGKVAAAKPNADFAIKVTSIDPVLVNGLQVTTTATSTPPLDFGIAAGSATSMLRPPQIAIVLLFGFSMLLHKERCDFCMRAF